MMGGFLSRVLILAFGYAYPAYECYKTVELNKPEIEQLLFWCHYWILVALVTVLERFADVLIAWLPLYSEAKLAFFIYLWYPRTKGTTYIYETFIRPYIAAHETDIDRNLLELRVRAGDLVLQYWQKAATLGQSTFFDVLKYVAAQSPPQFSRSRPAQQQQQQPQPSHLHRTGSITARSALGETQTVPSTPKIKRQASMKASATHTHEHTKNGTAASAVDEPPTSSEHTNLPVSYEPSDPPLHEAEEEEEVAYDETEDAEMETEEVDAPPPEERPIEGASRVATTRLRKRVTTAADASTGN